MTTLFAISKSTALEAQRQILGCEACTEDAEIRLCWILDRVTGRDFTTSLINSAFSRLFHASNQNQGLQAAESDPPTIFPGVSRHVVS